MVYAQPRICPREWDAQIPQGFWEANGSPNLGQMAILYNNQQKRVNLQNWGLCYPGWPHNKIERERKEGITYLDLARELKKLANMKMMIIPIVIGAFGTVTKGLIQGLEDLEIRGRVETIQTRSARILSFKLQWQTIR